MLIEREFSFHGKLILELFNKWSAKYYLESSLVLHFSIFIVKITFLQNLSTTFATAKYGFKCSHDNNPNFLSLGLQKSGSMERNNNYVSNRKKK